MAALDLLGRRPLQQRLVSSLAEVCFFEQVWLSVGEGVQGLLRRFFSYLFFLEG